MFPLCLSSGMASGSDVHLRRKLAPLHWRHNEHLGVSNHHWLVCLFSRLFRIIPKKISKPALLVLCDGNPPAAVGFRSQRTSNAETVSIDDVIMLSYSIRVPGWVLKCLNLITAPGSVSNQPGSVTWLATVGISKIHAVSWRNHIENQTTKGAQNT